MKSLDGLASPGTIVPLTYAHSHTLRDPEYRRIGTYVCFRAISASSEARQHRAELASALATRTYCSRVGIRSVCEADRRDRISLI